MIYTVKCCSIVSHHHMIYTVLFYSFTSSNDLHSEVLFYSFTSSNDLHSEVLFYWAIQAGLLTPLTFVKHCLSPLAAFTSGAYFLHNGRR